MCCVLFAFSSFAQTQNNDIVLQINPPHPKANENVTASLSSYVSDLNKARISWTLNGQLAIDSVGQKTFSFNTGTSGSQTYLDVQIQTSTGSFINKKLTISPVNIDLLWEAKDAYVPPFYKGKALLSKEGSVKIVALPSSNNTQKYLYSWKLDGENKPDSSGYGKNSYSFKNSYLEDNNLAEVSVSDLLGNTLGTGEITTKPGNPKMLFYQKDSALGTLWEKSLADGFRINPNGETIVVEPYFLSPKNLNSSDLEIKWSLGGSEIATPSIPNELSFKPQSGQSGSSAVKFSINNLKTLFLSLDKTLNVNF